MDFNGAGAIAANGRQRPLSNPRNATGFGHLKEMHAKTIAKRLANTDGPFPVIAVQEAPMPSNELLKFSRKVITGTGATAFPVLPYGRGNPSRAGDRAKAGKMQKLNKGKG